MSGRRPAKDIEAVIYGRTHHAGGNLALRVSQERAVRADLHACAAIPTFQEFCDRHRQLGLFKNPS